jgi:hypothetical protein
LLTVREVWEAVCSVQRVGCIARLAGGPGGLEVVRFAWIPAGWLRGSEHRLAYAQQIGQLVRHKLYAKIATRWAEVGATLDVTRAIRAGMLTDDDLRTHLEGCPDDAALMAEVARRSAVDEEEQRHALQIRYAGTKASDSPPCVHGHSRRWCVLTPYSDPGPPFMCADIQIRSDLDAWPDPRVMQA